MALGEAIAEVLALQPLYSSSNTEEMKQRGVLIRRTMPDALAMLRADLAKAAQLHPGDLMIEGRDGTGLKSEVPWVRFASREASPSATTGWYVVWLHRGDGQGVYLALAHGSAQFHAGALVARSDEELSKLMSWSRSTLADQLLQHETLVSTVELGSNGALAASYEKSCVAAFYYPATAIPHDATLDSDMLVMARLLGRLYEAERLGQTPLSTNPDVRDAQEAVAEIARPLATRAGQGFALTSAERRAIELRAMALATTKLRELGYAVKDVSANESFDLHASRENEVIKVEVKGTTGSLGSVLLTHNEVELHKKCFPANALIVVHSVQLAKEGNLPIASGGLLEMWMPWKLDDLRLRGITFMYQLA